MPTYLKSLTVAGGRPEASPVQAGVVYCSSGQFETDTDFGINDLVGIAILPAGCVPIDFILGATDIDDATSNTLTVGILNEDENDLVADSNFITASTIGRAGGIARADKITFLDKIEPDPDEDRIIAIKNAAAAGTPKAGTLYGTLLYRAVEYGA